MLPSTIFLLVVIFINNGYTTSTNEMKYEINTEWDSKPINHKPITIKLSWKPNDTCITAEFSGPFFNDPSAPNGPAGKPFPKLWDYEVAEIFFLASNKQYLEVEVSPHDQHLLLLLNGTRNMIKDELSMKYSAAIDRSTNTWYGSAEIPLAYLPRGVNKMNAYAIHGSNENRVYEALYPVPDGKYQQPDFHRLDYFKDFDLQQVINTNPATQLGTFWDNL